LGAQLYKTAPSGAALSRVTGYSTLTCRRALRVLIADGALIPGPSRNARPRVAGAPPLPADRDLASATRALSAGLATRRRANGLTQPELAERVGVSVTTIGHAETGRLWQSRQFWERADAVLGADESLLRLHDAYRAAGAARGQEPPADPDGNGVTLAHGRAAELLVGPAGERRPGQREWQEHDAEERPAVPHDGIPAPSGVPCLSPVLGQAAPGQAGPACIMIVWGDGTVTTVHPPETSRAPAPPGGAFPG
jgi:transcriptional regulator with XRE-family HTH domain